MTWPEQWMDTIDFQWERGSDIENRAGETRNQWHTLGTVRILPSYK